jgi:hypothetical protein
MEQAHDTPLAHGQAKVRNVESFHRRGNADDIAGLEPSGSGIDTLLRDVPPGTRGKASFSFTDGGQERGVCELAIR